MGIAARMNKQGVNVWVIVCHTDRDWPGRHNQGELFLTVRCLVPTCDAQRDHEPWKTPYCFVMSPLECSECFGDQLLHRTYTWHLTLVWLFTWGRSYNLRKGREYGYLCSKDFREGFYTNYNTCWISVQRSASCQIPSPHSFRHRFS